MYKIWMKENVVATKISTISHQKGNKYFVQEQGWSSWRHLRNQQDITHGRLKITKPSTFHSRSKSKAHLPMKDCPGNWFSRSHCNLLSNLENASAMSKECLGTAQPGVDLGIVRVTLTLLVCRMQELWDQGNFDPDFKEKPGKPDKELLNVSAWSYEEEHRGAMETPRSWECQEFGMSTRKASDSQWSRSKREACGLRSVNHCDWAS